MASRGAWRQGHASRLRLDNASPYTQLAQLIQSVAVRLDPCRQTPHKGPCVGSSLRAWVRGESFFGSGVPFRVPRRHVVVFSARMRKIFPFGAPRGVLSVHIELSKLSLICKSPGRALQASGEQGLTLLQPAPNRNILHIRAHFPTRWARIVAILRSLSRIVNCTVGYSRGR